MQTSLRHMDSRLSLLWQGSLSLRSEQCGDYSFEQPKTALREGTAYA